MAPDACRASPRKGPSVPGIQIIEFGETMPTTRKLLTSLTLSTLAFGGVTASAPAAQASTAGATTMAAADLCRFKIRDTGKRVFVRKAKKKGARKASSRKAGSPKKPTASCAKPVGSSRTAAGPTPGARS